MLVTARDPSRSRYFRLVTDGDSHQAEAVLLGHSSTAMKLYLFNLTNESLYIGSACSEHAGKLSVLPNAFTALPASKDNYILSSTGVNSEIKLEKASLGVEVERQYVVNLKKASSQWSPRHVSMPEGCPWRIYRDQVASLVLSWFSVKCP